MIAKLNGWLRRVPTGPLYAILLIPGAWWFWRAVTGRLGADPVRALEQELGLFALQLLIAALCVTPLREITGLSLARFRRCIGLSAFWYACCHLAAWLALDRQFDWTRILEDLTKRPYVILGMAAFLTLIPLAATSWDGAIRRLGGRRWRRLHRLAYAATALAAIHFIWLVKAWPFEPLAYGAGVLALLGWRLRGLVRRAGHVGA